MSYQKIIKIPDGVAVSMDGSALAVKGKKGELKREYHHPRVKLKLVEKELIVMTNSENKKDWAIVGTWNSLIRSMIIGVQHEYTSSIRIIYTHFPITVKVVGNEIHMTNFLGEKSPRVAKITGNVKVNAQKESITVTGIDKYSVGQTAASIETLGRNKRKKDTRIFQDGAYITLKASPVGEIK